MIIYENQIVNNLVEINGEVWEVCSDNEQTSQDFDYMEIEMIQNNNYTYNAINTLLSNGVTTNIHYVLGNNSIDEAIDRLKNNDFPKGINAVVFLLFKASGLGKQENILKYDDPRVKEFYELIDNGKFDFQIGFDSCNIPALLNFTKNIDEKSFDTCEAGRFSMYVTPDMIALPCSFDNEKQSYAYDISNDTIENAWNSENFNRFRGYFTNRCQGCPKHSSCFSGCPLDEKIILCQSSYRI